MLPLERQLRLLRLYALLTYPFACVPFLFLYFRHHGLDAQGYGEVIGVYYAAMFVCEVPTGALADRYGPKYAMVAGPLLLASGFATLLLQPSYGGFLLGEALLGMGHAVLSGPPATLLFETLREGRREHEYLKHEANISALRLLGTGASFLLGGALAAFGGDDGTRYDSGIVLTAVLCTGAAAIAARLDKPLHRPRLELRTFVGGLTAALGKRPLQWLLLYWIVLFSLLRFPFHDYQPYLDSAKAQEPWLGNAMLVGALFAALNLFAAPLSASLPKLVARFGRRPLFWAMPLSLCLSMAVMAFERQCAADGHGARWLAWLGVAMFFVQQVPFGLHQALLYEFVNHRLGSDVRTTVLSALSLATRLCYAGINVLLFSYQERRGIPAALLLVAGGGAVATLLVMWLRPRGLLRGSGTLDP